MIQSACAKLGWLLCLVPCAAALPLLPANDSVKQSAFELLGDLYFRAGPLATLPLLLAFVLELVGIVLARW